MYINTDASANSSFLVERAHPGPTELELLDTTSLRCTIGSLQVGFITHCLSLKLWRILNSLTVLV
jgi:hypothetical protein